MTRRERVIEALNHREPDMIPFHADFTQQEHDRMAAYLQDNDFANKNGSHLHGMQYSGFHAPLADNPEFFKDDFGVVWDRTGADKDIGVITSPVIDEPDISLWKEPVLDEARLRRTLEGVLAHAEDKFTFAGIGFSMFERAWSLCGMENVLMYMLVEGDFLHALLDRICEYNLKIIDIINEYPFDGVYFGDDWGQQKGLIMGPEHWREFIKPRVARMYKRVKSGGKYVLQHSCGDIIEIFPDLIEIGLSCYQTFQPEIYDIEVVKRDFGQELSFWGGVSTQQLLPYGPVSKIKEETKRIMSIMGQGGGYIAAPTHAVPGDVPPENIVAMFEIFQNQQE